MLKGHVLICEDQLSLLKAFKTSKDDVATLQRKQKNVGVIICWIWIFVRTLHNSRGSLNKVKSKKFVSLKGPFMD